MILKLHPKAEEDLKNALNYYYSIDHKLETVFINLLDSTFNKIIKFPKIYPYETPTAQKYVMNKFPYIILYEQYKDIIMILAIFHTKRDPKNLKDRT